MHGPAPAPPPHRPPARGTVVLLRVVFVAATVLSLGFLAWAALLRAAIVQRRALGWWLFGADLVAVIGVSLWSYGYPETDWRTDVAVAVMLLQLAGVVAYYLVADIRAVRAAEQKAAEWAAAGQPAAGWAQGSGPGGGFGPARYPTGPPAASAPPPAGYGSPHPPVPVPLHAQETRAAYPPPHPHPYAPEPHPYHPAPQSPPQPQSPPPPQRIDRVRAELDELSDYLRREEGR